MRNPLRSIGTPVVMRLHSQRLQNVLVELDVRKKKGAGGTFSFTGGRRWFSTCTIHYVLFSFKGGHRWTEQHPVFVVVVIVIVYFELREGDI